MSDITPNHSFFQDQKLPNELMMDIFFKADLKTLMQCRVLNKFWNEMLSPYSLMKELTFKNMDKYTSLFIHIELPPWENSTMNITSIDPIDGAVRSCELPFTVSNLGWWNVIGSDYGNICIRYTIGGFLSELIVWNPLMKCVRFLSDPASKQCCQAIFGYAFGYIRNTDNYFVVYVSKRHFNDKFLQYHVFNSSQGSWINGTSKNLRLHRLGYHSVVYQAKAFWINWVESTQYSVANCVVMFDIYLCEFKKIKIPRKAIKDFQYLIVYEDILCFVSHESRPDGNRVNFWKVDIEDGGFLHWKRITGITNVGIITNPSLKVGAEFLMFIEDDRSNDNDNVAASPGFSISKLNMHTKGSETFVYRTRVQDMMFKSVTKVLQGLLRP